ncbi:MAG: hypothetical protein IKA75_10015 [Bacteroidaceae bacterium]|nr:hypothetical protein [Bacteroidaceae bacterium]
MNKTIFLAIILCSLSIGLSAQITSSGNDTQSPGLDIVVDKNTSMSLTSNLNEMPLLLVYDNHVVEMENTSQLSVERKQYTVKELAHVIGVKPSKIKAYRFLKGIDATSIWGTKGFNGVLEVISPSMYRKFERKGTDVNFVVLNNDDNITIK